MSADALVLRDAAGRRVAAAWSEVDAYDKLAAHPEAIRVDRVYVSGRRDVPAGYTLRKPIRLATSTLKRRWPREWRTKVLVPLANSGDEWVALRGGHMLSPLTNALHARGQIDIAVPRRAGAPYLYRITPAGRRNLTSERWA